MSAEADLRKLLYSIIAVFVTCLTAVVVSNVRVSSQRERTDQIVCSLVLEAARTEAGKLAEYEQAPPTSLAGQAQRDAVAKALARWNSRADELGCNE